MYIVLRPPLFVQFHKPVGQVQGERAFLQIEIYEEVVVIGQYEFFAIFFIDVKQYVGRGLVHAGDFTQSPGAVIANAKTREGFVG